MKFIAPRFDAQTACVYCVHLHTQKRFHKAIDLLLLHIDNNNNNSTTATTTTTTRRINIFGWKHTILLAQDKHSFYCCASVDVLNVCVCVLVALTKEI